MKSIIIKIITIIIINIFFLFSLSYAGKTLRMDDEFRRIYNREELDTIQSNLNRKTSLKLLKKRLLHIPHVKFRVAVFSYEDPWGTDIGNALATIMAREILLNSNVYSLGVLTYEGNLKSDKSFNLSYFDKVEKLTKDQEVTISIWGRIQPEGNSLVIDTNVQVSEYSLSNYFSWDLKLPKAMGGGALQAHLKPDRIKLQRFKFKKEYKSSLINSINELNLLRENPNKDSKVVAKIPIDQVYTVIKRENNWVYLKIENGKEGWIISKGYCSEVFQPLLEPARFAASLLEYSAYKKISNATENLTNEALALEEQIKALDALNSETQENIYRNSIKRALRWVGPNRWTGIDKWTKIDRGKGTPPGGAAFVNVKALAEIAIKLHEEYKIEYFAMVERMREELEYMRRQNDRGWLDRYDLSNMRRKTNRLEGAVFDKIVLDNEFIKKIVNELATASLNDPNNVDVLKNLSILYTILNDIGRTEIVNMLVEKAINDEL